MENLLVDLKDMKIEGVVRADGRLLINTTPTKHEAACLDCQQLSSRVHSRYQRTLADLPCGGQEVKLQVQVRRFFCLNQECSRRLFAEQLPSVMKRSTSIALDGQCKR